LHRFCLIHPCDRQTDGQTDRQTELRWLRRAIAVPAVARKNPESLSHLGLNRYRVVTDRQMDRITIASARLVIVVHKN